MSRRDADSCGQLRASLGLGERYAIFIQSLCAELGLSITWPTANTIRPRDSAKSADVALRYDLHFMLLSQSS